MKHILHFHPDEARKLAADENGGTRWVRVEEGDTEVVVYLTEVQVVELIGQLQGTLRSGTPAP